MDQEIRTATEEEALLCSRETCSRENPFVMAVMKSGAFIGHIPWSLSCVCSLFDKAFLHVACFQNALVMSWRHSLLSTWLLLPSTPPKSSHNCHVSFQQPQSSLFPWPLSFGQPERQTLVLLLLPAPMVGLKKCSSVDISLQSPRYLPKQGMR